MKKDVIYIDIEDDITSIIGKVKEASASIVALVPPKRIGVLQSVVNLRLLQRAAGNADKRVVLITGDTVLSSLAAGVKIPVARSLQSKPELATIDALDIDDDEVIDGNDITVGDAEDAYRKKQITKDDEGDLKAGAAVAAVADGEKLNPAAALKKKLLDASPKKVPDFSKFQKKIFIIAGAVVLLIIVWWWAFVIAPTAKVVITAKTTLQNISEPVTLDPAGTTSADQSVVKITYQQVKKSVSIDFDATGKKDIGDKATGTMKLTRTSVSSSAIAVPVGTTFTSGSIVFVNTQAATLAGTTVGPGGLVQDTATIAVQASALGTDYNVASQAYFASVGGFDSQGSAMAGGTKQTVSVVSQDDVDKAKAQLATQDQNAVKGDLTSQFGSGFKIISDSFKADQAAPLAAPAVNEQATKAKLSAETTYTLGGIAESDLKTVLDAFAQKTIKDTNKQGIFNNGLDTLVFMKFAYVDSGKATATLNTTAYLGPKIDKAALKPQLAGKRYGEIQQIVEGIPNVDQVTINFSPFWVTTAPSADKITVEYSVTAQK